uniref:Sushi domain-containing protein n=1 Tax=Bos indicus x Bos taurus TaxID=30522 RepID=A0A4W2EAT7_BOBOX
NIYKKMKIHHSPIKITHFYSRVKHCFYSFLFQVKPFNYPVLKHGRLYYSYRGYFPVLVNQQFLYKCDQYFVPPSQHSWDYLTCTAEGWSPEESCLKCFFNNLGNRYTPSSEKKCLQGETVRVRCYEGYSLQNNQNTMTCTESGWSPPPRCIQSCDRPVFENTRAKSDGTWFRLNDRLDYECLNGYENRDGHTTVSIVCGQDGWSNKQTPLFFDNGDITSLLQSVNPPGMIVEYQCQAYYELRGDRNVVCQNGEWSEPPKCLGKQCNYPVIKHGRLYHSYRKYFPARVNQQFLYNCDQYFVPPSQYSWDYLTCAAEGWSPEEPCLKCIFNNLENGYTPSSEKKILQGETVRVWCYHGYSLQNNQNTMICTEQCNHNLCNISTVGKVKSCAHPPQLLNGKGKEMHKEEYAHNEVMEYACNPRFLMKGSHKIQCVDGEWTALPVCIEEERTCGDIPDLDHGKCGPPPPIDNGDITSLLQSAYPPGMSIEYHCQAYYVLWGNRNIVCQNGEWSQQPKCLGKCFKLLLDPGIILVHSIMFNFRKCHVQATTEGKVVYPRCG